MAMQAAFVQARSVAPAPSTARVMRSPSPVRGRGGPVRVVGSVAMPGGARRGVSPVRVTGSIAVPAGPPGTSMAAPAPGPAPEVPTPGSRAFGSMVMTGGFVAAGPPGGAQVSGLVAERKAAIEGSLAKTTGASVAQPGTPQKAAATIAATLVAAAGTGPSGSAAAVVQPASGQRTSMSFRPRGSVCLPSTNTGLAVGMRRYGSVAVPGAGSASMAVQSGPSASAAATATASAMTAVLTGEGSTKPANGCAGPQASLPTTIIGAASATMARRQASGPPPLTLPTDGFNSPTNKDRDQPGPTTPTFTTSFRIVEGTGFASLGGAGGPPGALGSMKERAPFGPFGVPSWEAAIASIVESCVKCPESWQDDFMNAWCGPMDAVVSPPQTPQGEGCAPVADDAKLEDTAEGEANALQHMYRKENRSPQTVAAADDFRAIHE